MYRIGTLTDSTGGVLLQGDTTAVRLSVKDTSVGLVAGRRVVVSDLGEGNNPNTQRTGRTNVARHDHLGRCPVNKPDN